MEKKVPIYLVELPSFQERLSFIIDICKYSNSDISKELKTSTINISKLKNGDTKNPGYGRMKELCDLLNANVNFLFGYSNIPFRNEYSEMINVYLSSLSDRDQRIIVRRVRELKKAMEEEDVESGYI